MIKTFVVRQVCNTSLKVVRLPVAFLWFVCFYDFLLLCVVIEMNRNRIEDLSFEQLQEEICNYGFTSATSRSKCIHNLMEYIANHLPDNLRSDHLDEV